VLGMFSHTPHVFTIFANPTFTTSTYINTKTNIKTNTNTNTNANTNTNTNTTINTTIRPLHGRKTLPRKVEVAEDPQYRKRCAKYENGPKHL
jgi:hypothetical protein